MKVVGHPIAAVSLASLLTVGVGFGAYQLTSDSKTAAKSHSTTQSTEGTEKTKSSKLKTSAEKDKSGKTKTHSKSKTSSGASVGSQSGTSATTSGGSTSDTTSSATKAATPPYTIPSNAKLVSSTSALATTVSGAIAGDTIVLRAGTYDNVSLTISKRLTIEAYPGETVWMDGKDVTQCAIYLSTTGANGSLVRGIGFKNYASTTDFSQRPGMVIVAASVTGGATIDGNIFRDSASNGLSIQGAHSVVKNNLITHNKWTGLHVNKADYIRIENNTITDNNTGNFATSGATAAAAGAKITSTKYATITGNSFTNNNATGLWLDLQCFELQITSNTANNNARHGIYYEVSTKGTITANTVKGNSVYGITLSGSNRTTVTGNAVSSNGTNIYVQEDPRTAANDAKCAAGASFGADCDSYNNTVQ